MAGPIPGVAYHLRRDRGTWEAKGRPSLPATGTVATITRADLAAHYGEEAYKPTIAADTVGVPAAVVPNLVPYVVPGTGIWSITTPGTVLDGLDIYGCVRFNATGCGIRNSRVRGVVQPDTKSPGTAAPDLVMGSSTLIGTAGYFVEDCTLWADDGRWPISAISGRSPLRVERTVLGNVTDAFHVWQSGLVAKGNLITGLRYVADASQAGDGMTHCDGLQYMGNGGDIVYLGNNTEITIEPFTTGQTLEGVLLGSNVNSLPCANATFDKNWFRGGYAMNLPVRPTGTLVITNNRMAKSQQNGTHELIATATVQAMWTFTNNTNIDTGAPVAVKLG